MAYSLLYTRMDLLYGSVDGKEIKSMTDTHLPASKSTIIVVGKLRYQVYFYLASLINWVARKLSNLSEELFHRAMKIRKG